MQDHVAAPLGIDLVAAAAGILRVAHANIVRGIRVVSVERGHDPRSCTLVPFGGAGPMHGRRSRASCASAGSPFRRRLASCARSDSCSRTCATT